MDYQIGIISYLDILGFSHLVESNASPDEVLDVLERFRCISTPDPELASMFEQHYVNFSDLSLRITNVLSRANRAHQVGILFHEVLDLLHMQMQLLYEGVVVRGGVVIDEIYHSPPFTFGPGLIAAYRLESKRALYPRIIIDEGVLSLLRDAPLLKASHHDKATEDAEIRSLIRQFRDKEWFIDYLHAAADECDDLEQYFAFLERHKSLILTNSARCAADEHTADKYRWLGAYHNAVVADIPEEAFRPYGLRKVNVSIAADEYPGRVVSN